MNIYFVLLVFAVLGSAISQMFFKILADKHGGSIQSIFFDKTFYFAMFFYFISFILWIKSASAINFSVLVPTNSLIIIFSGVTGYFYFNETITFTKLIAYALIFAGVFLLFSTNSQ